ncbi:MAG: type I methionyl aminopeptidase [Bacilli bacterium]
MIIIKSPREIALMKEAGEVLIGLFDVLEANTLPGKNTKELDSLARRYILSHGGYPSSYNYEGYPGNICISVNDTLIHGIPSKDIVLKEGDIVSYDCMCTKHGYVADACRTFPVGKASESALRLINVTRNCFFNAVKLVKPGIHLGVISHAIEKTATEAGYTLTSDYTGHGVGKEVHEDPYVPNVGVESEGPILEKGMTIAIEPMVNEGKVDLVTLDDGWTVKTKDGKLSCHYENTVVVTDDGYEIITLKKES